MKLSRTVTYALKATLQLAEHEQGTPIPCSRLASQGAMPERFLLQILRSLVTHGILKSTRGVDGGYVLLRAPEEISVLDVIEAIEGPLTHELAIGEGLSESSRDMLSDVLTNVNSGIRNTLDSVKLSDLVRGTDPPASDDPGTPHNLSAAYIAASTTTTEPAPTCQRLDQNAKVTPSVGMAPLVPSSPTTVDSDEFGITPTLPIGEASS